MKRLTWSIGAVALLAVGAPSWALGFRFSTEPIRVHASPGQVINRAFWLTLAREENPTRFKAHVEDWWRSEDGKQSFYRDPGTLSRSCGKWVTLNPVEATVAGGETLNVRVTIAVPGGARPGGYWCALTLDEVPDPLAQPNGVGVRFLASVSVGVFVYIGPLDQRARITAIEVHPDRAAITLRNEGDCPLGVEGRFEFIPTGAAEPRVLVPIPRGTLLPEPVNTAILSVGLPAPDALPAGRYLARAILDIGLDHYIGAQKVLDIQREEGHAGGAK